MATEAGHHSSRVYTDQAGDFHLNGAKFFNDAEVDIASQIETALAGPAAGLTFQGGVAQNSSLGVQAVVTGLTGIRSAVANVVSTATASTAGGPVYVRVGFTTNSGTLDLTAWKPTSTANTELAAATSTAIALAWMAFGS